jgi:hypothetical protein
LRITHVPVRLLPFLLSKRGQLKLPISGPERLRHVDFALVLAVVAIVARFLLPGVNGPMWLDEQMISMNIRARGFAELVGALDHQQSAPLGWLWITRALFEVFGQADWVFRTQSLVYGIGAVAVAWWYGRSRLGPLGSTALVALLGFNYSAIVYSTEVKHYGADLFWVLVLIVLARWVLDEPHSYRRHLWWWAAAAAGSWLSNGATFAAPGIALVLVVVAVWRQPLMTWIRMAVPGLLWLGSFAAHYLLSLRPATQNEYLNNFWAGVGYPPEGAGVRGTLVWFAQQGKYVLHSTFYLDIGLPPNPLAVAIFAVFTALFLAGLLIAFRRSTAFGFVLAVPLITALLLALARVVPLYGRLSLWIMPPILIAVAQAVDFKPQRRPALRWVAPALLLIMLVPFVNSVRDRARTPDFNDREAIAWLKERHQPGDLTLFVATAIRAAEWYDADSTLTPRAMAVSMPTGPDCDPAQLAQTVREHSRVLVYAGVRLQPYTQTYQVLEDRLVKLGTITDRAGWGGHGMTYVVELSDPAAMSPTAADPDCVKLY